MVVGAARSTIRGTGDFLLLPRPELDATFATEQPAGGGVPAPVQRSQYDAQARFEVVGSDTGKRYRICKGRVYNIQELDPYGVQVRAWCFMADGIATGDVNLAQKIALEAFETKVLAIANGSEGAVWPPVIRP